MPRKTPRKDPQPVDAYVGARIRLRRSLAGMSQIVFNLGEFALTACRPRSR
jgi:hypothetical protein